MVGFLILRKRLSSIILVFLLLSIIAAYQIFETKNQKPTVVNTWQPYHQHMHSTLSSRQVVSAKVIFYYTAKDQTVSYVVSQKRSNRHSKNYLLEFPGGKIDDQEDALTSIRRELKEEDRSRILLQSFNKQLGKNPPNIQYRHIILKNKQKHTLFKTKISRKDWKKLSKYYLTHKIKNKETFGFYLLEEKYY